MSHTGFFFSDYIVFRRMIWVFLGLLGSAIAAQSSYDLETRAVSFPGKPSSLGPLYSSSLNSAQGFRDNSYEDNAVTPTPSPTPIYRNQQPVSPETMYIFIYECVHVYFYCIKLHLDITIK